MNLKRYINTLFLVLTTLIVLTGCRKTEMPHKPGPSPFSVTVEESKYDFPASGGTANMIISAGTNGWWIVVPAEQKSWCQITKTYGSDDFTVPVKILPNTTNVARSVLVTVNPSYDLPEVTVTFNQAAQ